VCFGIGFVLQYIHQIASRTIIVGFVVLNSLVIFAIDRIAKGIEELYVPIIVGPCFLNVTIHMKTLYLHRIIVRATSK
jgi:hypothetical protein